MRVTGSGDIVFASITVTVSRLYFAAIKCHISAAHMTQKTMNKVV